MKRTNAYKMIAAGIVAAFILVLAACSSAEIVSKTPVDKRFTPAHEESTTFLYFIPMGNTYMTMPMESTKDVPDCYEVQYLITYDDGDRCTRWEEVTPEEYERITIEGRTAT